MAGRAARVGGEASFVIFFSFLRRNARKALSVMDELVRSVMEASVRAHRNWLEQARAWCGGWQAPSVPVPRAEACATGRWLARIADGWRGDAVFAELVEAHRRWHGEADRVFVLAQQGERERGWAALQALFAEHERFVAALHRFGEKLADRKFGLG